MIRFLKFAAVGGSGTVLNLGLFFVLVDAARLNANAGAVLCFVVAVSWNYLLNHLWTFRTQVDGERPSVRRYVRFVGVSLVGLGVNVAVLNLVITLLHPPYKVFAQAAGIACALILNYTGSNLIAFRARKEHS